MRALLRLLCWVAGHRASVDYTLASGAVLNVPDGIAFTVAQPYLLDALQRGAIVRAKTRPCERCGATL